MFSAYDILIIPVSLKLFLLFSDYLLTKKVNMGYNPLCLNKITLSPHNIYL